MPDLLFAAALWTILRWPLIREGLRPVAVPVTPPPQRVAALDQAPAGETAAECA